MEVHGVPETIKRADYVALVPTLGLVPDDLMELHCYPDSIEAVISAKNEEGRDYDDPPYTGRAQHRVRIPVVNE